MALAAEHGFAVSGVSHHFRRADAIMEYGMSVHSLDPTAFARISSRRCARATDVVEFSISPTGD